MEREAKSRYVPVGLGAGDSVGLENEHGSRAAEAPCKRIHHAGEPFGVEPGRTGL